MSAHSHLHRRVPKIGVTLHAYALERVVLEHIATVDKCRVLLAACVKAPTVIRREYEQANQSTSASVNT